MSITLPSIKFAAKLSSRRNLSFVNVGTYRKVHIGRYIQLGTYREVHIGRYIHLGTYRKVHIGRYIQLGTYTV